MERRTTNLINFKVRNFHLTRSARVLLWFPERREVTNLVGKSTKLVFTKNKEAKEIKPSRAKSSFRALDSNSFNIFLWKDMVDSNSVILA
jgi:hypothetical protein